MKKVNEGFTLLEILMVVATIAILAGIVVQAINPVKQLGDTRNAKRHSDVQAIADAVYQYTIDNQGSMPAGITYTDTEICKTGFLGSCSGLIDLSPMTASEKYLVAIPIDPRCPDLCAVYGAGYQIKKSLTNRVTVTAPDAENGVVISVMK
ncbi:MAG: prepilin-type N-terminal cleavage/methylation domain-containing protein [bacterium]|nr:prepilin-type N-terminal cleavage/methylation domain-containing protein [bacterium]